MFQKTVPNEYLFQFLDKICMLTIDGYEFNMSAYKKMIFNKYHVEFCQYLHNYYDDDNVHYIERPMTYNAFVTVLRQICKHNKILYVKKRTFSNSFYNIDYFIVTE